MYTGWTIFCPDPETAIECKRLAERGGDEIVLDVVEHVWDAALAHLSSGGFTAAVLTDEVSAAEWVQAASIAKSKTSRLVVALMGSESATAHIASDLGIVVLRELRPLLCALRLLPLSSTPWNASIRDLPKIDQKRFEAVVTRGGADRWRHVDEGLIEYCPANSAVSTVIGESVDVGPALEALRAAKQVAHPPMPSVQGVERQSVLDVILGPPRALSDPASKAALAPYDIPVPIEELCASPSRASSEAARIGFPVRIALASPDLRVWQHPDLVVDRVDNAARVRDVYRQIMNLARTRAPHARLLGVTVRAATLARALLWLHMRPLPDSAALVQIGFADPHGAAAGDATETVLPITHERLEQVLKRLRGSSLVLPSETSARRETVSALGDVLMRLAAFIHDWRDEIEAVHIEPLALLISGDVELREACVQVSDAFERSLEHSSSERTSPEQRVPRPAKAAS